MRNPTKRQAGVLLPLAGLVLSAAACGPDYITPDDVRFHLLLPSGMVAQDTVGRVTDDFFASADANQVEGFANFLKTSESGDDSTSAWAANAVESGGMEAAVSSGVAEDVGDVFCAASLVAAIARFDGCDDGDEECEVELILDACILRIGDGGDENARGRIVFNLKTQRYDGWSREALSLTFEDFETSNGDGTMDYLGGLIVVEATEIGDEYEEVIFSADIDSQERTVERGFLDDGVLWRKRVTAAMRFTHQVGVDREAGQLEILAFVDDTDDTRDESVVIQMTAESRRIDPQTELAGATLRVRGSNGAFSCTWDAASRDGSDGEESFESAGSCIDEDTGEVFNWSGSASSS